MSQIYCQKFKIMLSSNSNDINISFFVPQDTYDDEVI